MFFKSPNANLSAPSKRQRGFSPQGRQAKKVKSQIHRLLDK